MAADFEGGDDLTLGQVKTNVSPMIELGATGLRRSAGYINEEFLPALRGRKAVQVFREMSENDPIVGALLFAVDRLLRQIEWRVEPASQKSPDKEAAEFLESCMEDLSHTWDEFITEILTMLPYGWSWHEIVYKRRIGPWEKDPRKRSRFTDGKIGWRKMPIRSQETLQRWVFDDTGGIKAMVQLAPPRYETVVLPIDKCLLFRTTTVKNSPEGRAASVDTPVWTPNGWKRHGDLRVGDQVFDEAGKIRYVVAEQRWADRPRYRMTFNDGAQVVVDANHEWLTNTRRDRKHSAIRSTEEIARTVQIDGGSNHAVAWAQALDHPTQLLPIDPWYLGLWLGDGDSNTSRIACHADDELETMRLIESAGYPCKSDQNGNSENGRAIKVMGGAQRSLRELGVLHAKHIPDVYLRGDLAQRTSLLAGLMDSDGTVDADGRCEFTNTNKNLIDGVAHLVRSLGYQAHVSLRKRAVEGERSDSWCVKFTPTSEVFFLERKRSRNKVARGRQNHYIVSVERIENGDTNCIEVDSPSHLYLLGESLVPTHNSFLRNAYRPWFYKKRLEEIEGIGVERDLAGLPVAKVPHDYLSAEKGTKKWQMVDAFRKMVRSVRRDEQEGIVIPTAYDQDTKQPLFDFTLLNSGGSRTFDTNAIIQRYEQRILMSVLADFILVGHEQTGSYALHTDKTGLFRASINSVSQAIADVLNRYAVPRLFSVNGWKMDELPQFVPGDVDPPDLNQLSTFMGQMAQTGIQWFPDPELEKFIRKAARLPDLDDSSEKVRETQKKQADIMAIAEQQLQALQMKHQAEQGSMQIEQQKMGLHQQGMGIEQQKMGIEQQAMQTEDHAAQMQKPEEERLDFDSAERIQGMKHKEELHQGKLSQLKARQEAMKKPPAKKEKK